MNSTLGNLGPVGLALVLTVVLCVATTPGGKFKPLGWGPAFALSLLAGASYNGAGEPFDIPNKAIRDMASMAFAAMPGLTWPALALTLFVITAWTRLSVRQASMMGIVLFYVASQSGGAWGTLSAKILIISQQLAA